MESSNPVSIPQAIQMAQQAIVAGDALQAESILRQILAAEPEQPQALQLYGRLALAAQQADAAVKMLSASARLQPDDFSAHLDLGNALLMLGRMEEAAGEYRRCLEIDPGHPGAWSNLGIVLHELGRSQEALEAFEKALALDPTSAIRHSNLGTALSSLGRSHEAANAHREAARLNPDQPGARQNLAHVLTNIGRLDESIEICRELLAKHPNSPPIHSNLLVYLMYSPASVPEEQFEEYRRWNQMHAAPLQGEITPHANDRSPHRRLRVGYFSPDFREHSVSFFFEGLLAAHDPAAVETFCYADMLRRQDDMSDRLKSLSHHWTNITGIADAKVIEIIRKDQIDILVDLAGHTSGARPLLFARKPAPIQVSYLGYPNTTGLDAIDYSVTDPYLDPPGDGDSRYSEQLVGLPRTFACYRPPADAPEVAPLPSRAKGYITFGSFNALSKVNAQVIRVWSQILGRVAGSKLRIGARGMDTKQMVEHVHNEFAAHGISPDRLELVGRQPRAEYLAAHGEIDVLLDTFPVNGHTISCHALWMGVPVVSLAGETRFSRLGASVLNNLDLPDLLAENEAQYIQIAEQLAGDLQRLEELRGTLRHRMSRSPLMDFGSLAWDLETAYRQMWRAYVRRP